LTKGEPGINRYLLRMSATGSWLFRRWRRPGTTRGVALVLCMTALATMLGGQIHSLAVTHVRCLAHGELEHADRALTAPVTDDDTAGVEAAPLVTASHDHCAIAAAQGRSLSYKRTITTVALMAPPELRERPRPTVPRPAPPRATVLLAPKTSPPSA
jgi:hypothetical protein